MSLFQVAAAPNPKAQSLATFTSFLDVLLYPRYLSMSLYIKNSLVSPWSQHSSKSNSEPSRDSAPAQRNPRRRVNRSLTSSPLLDQYSNSSTLSNPRYAISPAVMNEWRCCQSPRTSYDRQVWRYGVYQARWSVGVERADQRRTWIAIKRWYSPLWWHCASVHLCTTIEAF